MAIRILILYGKYGSIVPQLEWSVIVVIPDKERSDAIRDPFPRRKENGLDSGLRRNDKKK